MSAEPAPIPTPGSRRKAAIEALIVLVIAVAGAAVGGLYRHVHVTAGLYADFPQVELGAAVALACGLGYHDLSLDTPPVAAFLLRQVDVLRCADLPANVPLKAPSFTQGLYRYLFGTIALTWKLVGEISFKSLTPLFAVAYALTLVSAYAIFRAGMGRVAAALATIPLLVSVVHLGQLPNFRDYAKAPFILGLLAIIAWLPRAGLDRRRIVAAAAAFGVVLGLGFGFRNDLLIVVAPWALIVVCGLPGPIWAHLRLKGLALAVSAVAFLITAAPILSAYSRGSNSGHVTLLGLMSQPFDSHLGISRSLYDWGHYYADGFANRLVTRHGQRAHGVPPVYLSADYDRAAAEYVALIAKQFPADILSRAYGSVLKVVDALPFHAGTFADVAPQAIAAPRLRELYDSQRTLLDFLDGTGAFITVLALLIISSRGLRAALLVLVCLTYFAGYPAIQFTGRHLFHLEFIAWGALAVVLETLAILLLRRRVPAGEGAAGPPARTIGLRVAAFSLIAVAIVPGSLFALRAYQAPHVRARIEADYLSAPRDPVAIEPQTGARGRVLLAMPGLWPPEGSTGWLSWAYLVVELSSRSCGTTRVPLTFRYESPYPDGDFSRDYVVDLDERGEPTVVLFPVFHDANYVQFKGILLGAVDRSCVVSVSRIKPEREPNVLLFSVLPPDWRESRLYSTLTAFERNDEERRHTGRLTQVTTPAMLPLPRRFDLQRFAAPNPATEFYAPIVTRRDGGALAMKGFVTQHAVLIPEQQLAQGTIAVARGAVREGGLSLSVTDAKGKLTSVTVESPGPFVIALQVPESESYTVVLDAFVVAGSGLWQRLLLKFPRPQTKVDMDVDALGWLPPLESGAGARLN